MLKKVVEKAPLLKNVLKGNTFPCYPPALPSAMLLNNLPVLGVQTQSPTLEDYHLPLGLSRALLLPTPHRFREGDCAPFQILLESRRNILVIPWSFAEVRLAL